MVQLDTILESLVEACNGSDLIPSAVTYSTIILDSSGEHSNIRPPVIEFSVDSIERNRSRNTERVGVETDNSGKEIGYVYTQWFDAVVNAEVLTVSGTQYTHRELEQNLRNTIYQYDSHGLSEQLPDPSNPSDPLRDVSWVSMSGIQPDADFALSPSVRTRTITIEVGFTHVIRTTDLGIEYDQVEDVDIDVSVVIPDEEA